MKSLRATLILFLTSLILCCVLYPAVLWAFGQTLFPTKANGSLVTKPDGTPVGSSQIAQAFTKDEYFWPRPSAAGYNAAATGGSNWGASQPKLRDRVAQQLGPLVRYRSGQPVGPDIEKWFGTEPDRAAKWAALYPTSATNWAKADLSGDKYGLNGEFILTWMKDYPEVISEWKKANPSKTGDPKPEDLVTQFFDTYVKLQPGTFPGQVEMKAADGTPEKRVQPVKEGDVIRSNFFDQWLQDPANKDKVADIQQIPADFVTASGAGMDPHITLRNARWQLDRVVETWGAKTKTDTTAIRSRIEAILNANASSPLGGLAGEPLVNVLEVNRKLDAEFPATAK